MRKECFRTASLLQWQSPCGLLAIAEADGALVMVDWVNGWHHASVTSRVARRGGLTFAVQTSLLIERTVRELTQYFAGERRDFDLPLRFYGTPFQELVWGALRRIPYGEVATYSDVAAWAGSPRAFRAVGVAVGENPFSIVVPCHRVVGRDKTLTGYGGGYEAKRRLLALEWGVAEEDLPFADGAALHGHARSA